MKLGRELLAYARQGALAFRPRAGVRGEGDETVVFVHGHGAGPATFDALTQSLREAGHRRFAAFRYGLVGTVRAIAGELDRFVETHAGRGPVHVVAHSLGGIVARVWLQEVAPVSARQRVRSLVTLSTAHGGIRALPGARHLPLVREILAGHELMSSLERTAHALVGKRLVSVVSAWDHFVPADRAGFAHAEVVTVDDAGHVGVLFHRDVHAQVAKALRASADEPASDRAAAPAAGASAARHGRSLPRR
jgi:pimeloyl-ACP methyl ester carboxylesterase